MSDRASHWLCWNAIRRLQCNGIFISIFVNSAAISVVCPPSTFVCRQYKNRYAFQQNIFFYLLQSILNKILTFAKYSLQNIYLCKEFFTKYILLQSISNKILTLAKHSLQNIYMCNVFLTKYLPVQRFFLQNIYFCKVFFTEYLLLQSILCKKLSSNLALSLKLRNLCVVAGS